MSETPNPETPNTETPAPKPKDPDGYAAAFRTMQADTTRLEGEVKARDSKLAEQEKELIKLRAQVDGYTKREREGQVVSKIRDALPHASNLELRGVLAALHEEGAIDRHSDKPDETAAKALELIKSKAPALMRPPAQGGGPNGAPPQNQGRKSKSLI